MIPPFEFDRAFEFPLSTAELWKRLEQTDTYTHWWPWLRQFEMGDLTGLTEGAEASCAVRGPLPYWLRFTVAVRRVVREELVEAQVDGDIRGPARLELRDDGDGGTTARLAWTVQVVDPALRAMTKVARPLMAWGHDLVVTRGVGQFRRRALGAGAE